jgi:hypothetical protein
MGRIKNDVWKIENEWRLMWYNTDTRMKIYRCPIEADAIVKIVLGQSMGDTTREDFISEAKHNCPNANVLRAKKRFGDLALEFEPAS